MPQVQYNDRTINYTFLIKSHLKYHYIAVDKEKGVVLKGRRISRKKADQMILKKAKWILKKLEQVEDTIPNEIETGSLIPYLGKNYSVEVISQNESTTLSYAFDQSVFKLIINPSVGDTQQQIRMLIDLFYYNKAIRELPPRVNEWSQKTGLRFNHLKFRKKRKQWASCTGQNNIIFNTHAIKLSPELIDYLIVHELCHTKVKNHSQAFYEEVAKFLPNWRELNRRLKKEVVGY